MEEIMASSHRHLPLDQVRPGMVLSDQLLDIQGQILLPEGAVLTEAMLALMPRHGIAALPIVTTGVSDEELARQREHHRQTIAQLFRKNDADDGADWATGLLRSFVGDYRLGKEEAE
jgi:hypothetical protein